MALERLGKTGLRVSPIGFGAFKIGRNVGIKYPTPYDLPSEEEVHRLLNGVWELGINYIDTAPAYGLSEERIGQALDGRQNEFVVSTKVGESFEDGQSRYDYSEQAVRESVSRSLHRLRRDALDMMFIHSDGRDLEILNQTPVVAVLEELKGRGLIRAIGLSGKTPEGAEAALGWADVIMVEYNRSNTSHEGVISQARQRGVGVIVKKGLASGRLPASEAVRFVLANPGVNSLVVGGLNLTHLRENLEAALAVRPVER